MTTAPDETRPRVTRSMPRAEFERWYWPVSDLKAFCDVLGVSKSGRKADLRQRVAFALEGRVAAEEEQTPDAPLDSFDWKTADLTLDTKITPSISFGPNVRRFFKSIIGPKFVCHSDFMDWMRSNVGETLGVAVEAWHILEDRKKDPAFRREIATCNNYLQYLRDIRDANPELTLDQAKHCWDHKKIRPAQDGYVVYQPSDLGFLNA